MEGVDGMRLNRRVGGLLASGRLEIERKVAGLTPFLSATLFFLFLGFVAGNLFGTFLAGLRPILRWDGYIILSVLGFIEITNYGFYDPSLDIPFLPSRGAPIWKMCQFFKIGLMLGFFVDAFKVGS
jgi:hypothetical protein